MIISETHDNNYFGKQEIIIIMGIIEEIDSN